MKKKLLKITGVILVLVAVGGLWGYNKYFRPDPVIQQQLNDQFGPGFFDSFGDDPAVNNAGAGNDSRSDDAANSGKTSNNETSSSVLGSTEKTNPSDKTASASGNNTAEPVTENQIKLKYESKFNSLQNVAVSRLDTLYSAAIQEYKQRSKDGTLNRSQLAQKYLQAANMLEANVDSKFNSTLNAMKNELIANNLPTDSVDGVKSEYERAKSAERSQLLAKVRI